MFKTFEIQNVSAILEGSFAVSITDLGKSVTRGVPPEENLSSAADEVDDLESIAVGEIGRCPFIAGNDLAIEFNRNAVLLHPEVLEKHCQRLDRGKLAGLAVDLEIHGESLGFNLAKPKLAGGGTSRVAGLNQNRSIRQ